MLLRSVEQQFGQERRGVGPRCSFCGSSTGPFREVEGLFTVLMCERCQAVRTSSSRAGTSITQAEMPDPPAELLADHDPGQPWLHWGCALCDHRVVMPQQLEVHTAAEHPGWVARYEIVRPYPRQLLRVVFRRVEEPPAS
jgi:hypothetical protein